MSRVLVTGGAGFIGSHTVDLLVSEGHEVCVLDDLSTGSIHNLHGVEDRLRFVQGDVRNPKAVRPLMEGAEAVLHFAALTSVPASVDDPMAYHDVDATGTLTLLVEARAASVPRFVFASSCAVYGDAGPEGLREEQGGFPLSPYAAAKFAAEAYCTAYRTLGLHTVVLRYFNVYGPRQRPDLPFAAVVPLFLQALAREEKPVLYGTGEQTRDFIHVRDVARANVRAATGEPPPSPIYNIASGRSESILRLLEAACRAMGRPPAHRVEPARAGDLLHSVADIRLARKELGFEPAVSLEEGLTDMAQSRQGPGLSPGEES